MIDRILYGRFYKGDIMSRMTKEEVKQRVCKVIVDAQPRLRELAESIKQNGLLQSITVRDIGNGFYELIAGAEKVSGILC